MQSKRQGISDSIPNMDTTIIKEIDELFEFLGCDMDSAEIYARLEERILKLGDYGPKFLIDKLKNDKKNILGVLTLLGNLKITESIGELIEITTNDEDIDNQLEAAISLAKMDVAEGFDGLFRLFTESETLPVDWMDEIACELGTDRSKKLAMLVREKRSLRRTLA